MPCFPVRLGAPAGSRAPGQDTFLERLANPDHFLLGSVFLMTDPLLPHRGCLTSLWVPSTPPPVSSILRSAAGSPGMDFVVGWLLFGVCSAPQHVFACLPKQGVSQPCPRVLLRGSRRRSAHLPAAAHVSPSLCLGPGLLWFFQPTGSDLRPPTLLSNPSAERHWTFWV